MGHSATRMTSTHIPDLQLFLSLRLVLLDGVVHLEHVQLRLSRNLLGRPIEKCVVNNKFTLPKLHDTAICIKHGYILDFGRKFGIGG